MKPHDPSPLISVVVPAFNAEAWIGATLDSVAAQTWPNLEILIVDDGSTDRTAAIAEAWCAREPRARLLRKANGGVSSARNHGIRAARGEWIAPIDSDDLWNPTRIEKMARAGLAAAERPGFVYAWSRLIDLEGRVTGSLPPIAVCGRALRSLFYVNAVGNGSGLLIDASAAHEAGGYDEGLLAEGAHGCEDWLLQLDIAARRPVECVPEYLIGYRIRPDSMSADGERAYRSWLAARRRFEARHGPIEGAAARLHPALRWFLLAEHKAYRGAWGGTAALLAKSLAADPVRTTLWLAARIGRRLRRSMFPGAVRPDMPRFEDCPTIGPIGGDPHAFGPFERAIERLEARRLERLAGLSP